MSHVLRSTSFFERHAFDTCSTVGKSRVIPGKVSKTFYKGVGFLVIILLCPNVVGSLRCSQGQYLKTYALWFDECLDCSDGTFMPNIEHQKDSCRACEKLKDPELEILVSPCNKTHDAVIHCVEGYYRDLARNPRETGTCKKCTKCSGFSRYTGQACSTYRDSICCMDENFDVAPNHHGVPLCRERPWFCRQGQYFDTRSFQCLPCPSNTFMPEDLHVRPECFKCSDYTTLEVNSPLNSVIIKACNSTHDTVLSCKEGYFTKPTMGYRSDAIGCHPCTKCSTNGAQYEGQKCNSMEDTVCCPQANMTVVKTRHHGPVCCPQANMTVVKSRHHGPVCTGRSAECDGGHCLQYKVMEQSSKCVPCNPHSSRHKTNGVQSDNEVTKEFPQRKETSDDKPEYHSPGDLDNKSPKTSLQSTDPRLLASLLMTMLLVYM